MKGFYTEKVLGKFSGALRDAEAAVRSGEKLKVCISKANSKMGAVSSVSLLPFLTCPYRCKESCGSRCYAAKIANIRPSVLQSYAINTALAKLRPALYWAQVDAACKHAKYFRFHVSGDVPSADYLLCLIRCAEENADTQMLLFTKRYELVNAWLANGRLPPTNLHILYSGWTNLQPINPFRLPETNVIEHGAEPNPTWKICGGNCYNCARAGCGCWTAQSGDTIAFPIH